MLNLSPSTVESLKTRRSCTLLMTSAADLFALQEIDLRRTLAGPSSPTSKHASARPTSWSRRARASRTLPRPSSACRSASASFDAQLQDLDAKIGPLEKKLYDGSVRNPKELTDLQKELDIFKANRGKLDDEGLQLIESLDAANRALSSAQARTGRNRS